MAPETKDEISMVVALAPLLRMNLRARVDEEITSTDASPEGAGGGIARSFKREPDTEEHDQAACFYCNGSLDDGTVPCPAQCNAGLCYLGHDFFSDPD